MQKKNKQIQLICIIMSIIVILSLFTACGNNTKKEPLTSVEQLTTQRIGVQSGTLYEVDLVEKYPDLDIKYFTTGIDMVIALENSKIDGFLIEDITYQIEKEYYPSLRLLEGSAMITPVSIAIGKNGNYKTLEEQFNTFIKDSKTNGVMDQMDEYWVTNFDPNTCSVDRSGITGENGVLKVAVENGYEPFSYINNGEHQGYDVDFVYRFCREDGYEPEIYQIE